MELASRIFFILLVSCEIITIESFEACELDDPCTTFNEDEGVVKHANKCKRFKSLKTFNERRPCGWIGRIPLICCPSDHSTPVRFERKIVELCNSFDKRPEGDEVLSNRVIGGKDCEVGEFPHFAALGYRNNDLDELSFDCAGSLISSTIMISAAHCCTRTRRPVLVRLGKV